MCFSLLPFVFFNDQRVFNPPISAGCAPVEALINSRSCRLSLLLGSSVGHAPSLIRLLTMAQVRCRCARLAGVSGVCAQEQQVTVDVHARPMLQPGAQLRLVCCCSGVKQAKQASRSSAAARAKRARTGRDWVCGAGCGRTPAVTCLVCPNRTLTAA